jgi:hypothetical protein
MTDKTNPNIIVDDIIKALDANEAPLARALLKSIQGKYGELDENRKLLLGDSFNRIEWDPDAPDAPWVAKPEDKRTVPWERLNQSKPEDLPDPDDGNPDEDRFPYPWGTKGRGNGHEDIIANNGAYVAHVYCWDQAAYKKLDEYIKRVNV